MSFRKLPVFALFIVLAYGPSVAEPAFDAPTRAAIQDVISKQLKAFAQGDAEAAEAFASPGIQKKFPDASGFLAMVKKSYAALVAPKSTEFGETADTPSGTIQKMTVVAADGTVWTATYILEKADGGWRINGCGLTKIEGQQAI